MLVTKIVFAGKTNGKEYVGTETSRKGHWLEESYFYKVDYY